MNRPPLPVKSASKVAEVGMQAPTRVTEQTGDHVDGNTTGVTVADFSGLFPVSASSFLSASRLTDGVARAYSVEQWRGGFPSPDPYAGTCQRDLTPGSIFFQHLGMRVEPWLRTLITSSGYRCHLDSPTTHSIHGVTSALTPSGV